MSTQETDFGVVRVTKKDNYAIVMLNRPEKLNALSPELIDDLINGLNNVGEDEAIRAVLITGAGRAFSAGGDVLKDINPLRDMEVSKFEKYFGKAEILYRGVIEMEKPVVAAINGFAVGAGLDLALACDIRIAAEDAQMGEFFVRMGLIPELGIFMLPRLVGLGWAKLICLTGDTFDAAQAKEIGLIEKVVPTDKLMSAAEELVIKIANGPASTRTIKKALNESLRMTVESSLDYIARLQYQMAHSEDHKEAVTSWIEKRKPTFTGK